MIAASLRSSSGATNVNFYLGTTKVGTASVGALAVGASSTVSTSIVDRNGHLLATDASHAFVQVFDKTTGKYSIHSYTGNTGAWGK